MFDFGREVASDVTESTTREWLVTNGIGGYASGTVANLLTRRYHGLLVAALKPPVGRTLLLSRVDETATYDGQQFPLFTNQWNSDDAALTPAGYLHQERFRLEGTTPVWTYALRDARLEKRIWMQPGANTTYIRYELVHGTLPLHLEIKALVNYRDFHGNTHAGDWHMQIEQVEASRDVYGVQVLAYEGATPFYLLSNVAHIVPKHEWYRHYFLRQEAFRGLHPVDDNLYAAECQVTLVPGASMTLVASTEAEPNLDGMAAYSERVAYEKQLIVQSGQADAPDWVQHLMLAADQFIVQRTVEDDTEGRSIIAGYPWFGDWGRDTMISLPGLTLTTQRYDVAARILRTFAKFVDQGMLPNRFPDDGEEPEYNTVDATLWYFEAIRAYYAATGDDNLVHELYPTLQQIIDWHQRGTRYNIHVDPADGLLYAGEPGVQLTWMDAKVGDWVVTPRTGKAVEINALWYNALRIMADFTPLVNRADDEMAGSYTAAAEQVATNFERFWNTEAGYCYDVIDSPDSNDTEGRDAALRPNQLMAVSLPHSPLTPSQQQAVVDTCGRHLVTSLGLHSLTPEHPDYVARYGGGPHERDAVYHQGAIWGWLIEPFVKAHLRVHQNPQQIHTLLQPFVHHLATHGIGSICEIAEGNLPYRPRGCIAQAWSVAALLQSWVLMESMEGNPL